MIWWLQYFLNQLYGSVQLYDTRLRCTDATWENNHTVFTESATVG